MPLIGAFWPLNKFGGYVETGDHLQPMRCMNGLPHGAAINLVDPWRPSPANDMREWASTRIALQGNDLSRPIKPTHAVHLHQTHAQPLLPRPRASIPIRSLSHLAPDPIFRRRLSSSIRRPDSTAPARLHVVSRSKVPHSPPWIEGPAARRTGHGRDRTARSGRLPLRRLAAPRTLPFAKTQAGLHPRTLAPAGSRLHAQGIDLDPLFSLPPSI